MADTNEALKERFVEAANSILRGEPLKIAKGIDDAQLNAVYSLAFSYYSTGRYDEALKLFKFLVMFDHLSQKFWIGLGSTHQITMRRSAISPRATRSARRARSARSRSSARRRTPRRFPSSRRRPSCAPSSERSPSPN